MRSITSRGAMNDASGPVLIVYETRFGTCAKIATQVQQRVRFHRYDFDVEPAPGARPISVEDFSAVIIIAPVYNGQHPESIERFVRQHTHGLSRRPTAFISVSIGAAARLRFVRAGIRRVAERLFEKTGWRPSQLLYTGGSLDYPLYTAATRRWMRTAAFVFGLPTDTTRRHELTRWDDVFDTVDALIAELEIATELETVATLA